MDYEKKDVNPRLKLLMPEDITIKYIDDKNTEGIEKCKFIVAPLESGFGVTIGNALRRVLLGYIPGYAIYKINIEGVTNEFACIDGVRQDVLIIVQKLKQIILKKKVDDESSKDKEEFTIVKKGGSFTGADIDEASKLFTVLNKDLVICDFNDDVTFKITISINKGYGYEQAKIFNNGEDKLGDIFLDCLYSPIINVSYNVEEKFHLNEEKRDYDSLTMEVVTNGSIKAEETVVIAAGILIQHFQLFLNNEKYKYSTESNFLKEEEEQREKTAILLKKSIWEANAFSPRCLNCLKEAGIMTVEQLLTCSNSYLMSIRNFGKKSMGEISRFKEVNQLYLYTGQNAEKLINNDDNRNKKE